jgi:hypothetical protein
MADRLYLSMWAHRSSPLTMQRRFLDLVRAFPVSKLDPRLVAAVRGVAMAEAPLAEQSFAAFDDGAAIEEFFGGWAGPDACFELECAWDLLQPRDGDWKLTPTRVVLLAYGREFEREEGEDFRIEFGVETPFLPIPESPASFRAAQGNIRSLLRLVEDTGRALPLERRKLWSESGGNFAERLAALAGGIAE